jgi:hypothetical protein
VSQVSNPAFVDPGLDCRAVTFENPTGERGRGGTAGGGRKGSPLRNLAPGEAVVLADVAGPGTVRHIWMTVSPSPPEDLRAQVLEVFYDGAAEPSVSVPVLDLFGLPHGRLVPLTSALVAVQEGRGLNSYVPLPFRRRIRIVYTNHASRAVTLYHQIDLTLEDDLAPGTGFLHATFGRENPTVRRRDFVITEGIRGPGRFLGCVVGVRVLDEGMWYGEGEVKVYRDGDREHPTICGTGLEDYVGTAWGLGPHCAPYGGAPLDVREPVDAGVPPALGGGSARFVGFYRWHLLDPIMFRDELRVTIQQIGAAMFPADAREARERYEQDHPLAGSGWTHVGGVSVGIVERVDDYCATAFVYATTVQPIPRVDVAAAVADIGRLPHELAHPMETFAAFGAGTGLVAESHTDA